ASAQRVGEGEGGLDVSSSTTAGQDNPHCETSLRNLEDAVQAFARPSQLRARRAGPGPRAARACRAPGSLFANDRSIPSATKVGTSADPPYETSGNGIPVIGNTLITAPMLTTACTTSHEVAPAAARRMNGSLTRRAIRRPA